MDSIESEALFCTDCDQLSLITGKFISYYPTYTTWQQQQPLLTPPRRTDSCSLHGQKASRCASGLNAALDLTVVNPLQSALLKEAAATPGHALEFRYDKKMDRVAEACKREDIVFLPLVSESLGGWHKVAEREVKKLAAAKARQGGRRKRRQ